MLSWRAPLCGVDPPQGVGNYRAARDAAALTGPRLRFVCVVSRRANTGGERGELLSRVRYSDADRDPAGSYGGGVRLYVYRSCWRAWRRVVFSPYLSIFRYRVLLEIRSSLATLVRLPWRLAIAVLMASHSTESRFGTVADSAKTWGGCRAPAVKKAISSGSCAAVTVSSSVDMTIPSTTFRISRTFPGQAYRSNASMTFASKRFTDTPWRCDTSRLKCSTSSAMSSLRSRSAGMRSVVTDTR